MTSSHDLGVAIGFRKEGLDLVELRQRGEYRWRCNSFDELAIQIEKIVDQIHRDEDLGGEAIL